MSTDDVEKFVRVSPSNMFLPILAFMICAIIAVVLQLIHERRRKKGLVSSFGRQSSLDIYNGLNKADNYAIMGAKDDHVQKAGGMNTKEEEDGKYEIPQTKKISWNRSTTNGDV